MDMKKTMKKVGFQMNILMGFTLSLCMSTTNTLSSDKPSLNTWLISFGVSALISFAISFLIPMRKLELKAVNALKLKEKSVPGKLVSTFISDMIYTPAITLAMVALVRIIVTKASHGHAHFPPFMIMFLKSFIFSFIVSYCIIYIINPLILKFVLKMNGVAPGTPPPDSKKPE